MGWYDKDGNRLPREPLLERRCEQCHGETDAGGYCLDPSCQAHWAYLTSFSEAQRDRDLKRLQDRLGGSAQGQKYGLNWRWRRARPR